MAGGADEAVGGYYLGGFGLVAGEGEEGQWRGSSDGRGGTHQSWPNGALPGPRMRPYDLYGAVATLRAHARRRLGLTRSMVAVKRVQSGVKFKKLGNSGID